MDEDTQFLLKRASEEATRAISSETKAAADAHQGLAIHYSAKALLQLSNQDLERAERGEVETS